jgi:nucleoside-diphosphate-sugar epimerase
LNHSVFEEDLASVLSQTHDLWEELRGGELLVTGGTGFFGKWLLASFIRANDELGLGARAVVLSREPEKFVCEYPVLANNPALAFAHGDVRDFDFPSGHFSHIIHAATDANTSADLGSSVRMFDTITAGTRRVLDFAVGCQAPKVLFVSSGAVYGKQPPEMENLDEDYCGAPNTLQADSAYGEGKRAAEMLCAAYSRIYGLEVKIARCFAFLGPYIPLSRSFAAGNFIRYALDGGPVVVNGDGTPVRSYMYTADLAVWLWTILFRGASGRAYNVGSESSVSILELAQAIGKAAGLGADVKVRKEPVPGLASERYVPSVRRASSELGLEQLVGLDEAVRRTLCFYSDPSQKHEMAGSRL